MKKILVPSDFSACANYAADAAFQLARRFQAKVFIYHRLDMPRRWLSLSPAEKEAHDEVQQLYHNTQALLETYRRDNPDLEIETSFSTGKLTENIAQLVKEQGIDLIVMGSYGVSGKSEYFIGSNTQKVVRMVHCPVLVVKEKIGDLNFDKAVFASSFLENEKQAFLRFKEFVKPFIPEIFLVVIHTSTLFDPPYYVSNEAMDDFKALCPPFKCTTHIFKDLSIERGVRTFADEIDAKLIGISNFHRHPLKRMLAGSNVEALINHSRLPVLSIDFEIQGNNNMA